MKYAKSLYKKNSITSVQRLCIRLKERELIKSQSKEHQTTGEGCWYTHWSQCHFWGSSVPVSGISPDWDSDIMARSQKFLKGKEFNLTSPRRWKISECVFFPMLHRGWNVWKLQVDSPDNKLSVIQYVTKPAFRLEIWIDLLNYYWTMTQNIQIKTKSYFL